MAIESESDVPDVTWSGEHDAHINYFLLYENYFLK